jgi:DnaJ-class molecular chaperone
MECLECRGSGFWWKQTCDLEVDAEFSEPEKIICPKCKGTGKVGNNKKEQWTLDGKIVTHLPAIPPNDYKGTMADWLMGLCELGKREDEGEFYGDVVLTVEEYNSLLQRCEEEK